MEFLLIVLLSLYIYLSVKAIKKLDKKVDNQSKFIDEYMRGTNVVHGRNQEENSTVTSVDTR